VLDAHVDSTRTERRPWTEADGPMPALYLGHGAPPLVDDELWTSQLASWADGLPRPRSILIVSAHWESAPLTLGATADAAPLTYDFYGFPQRYYEMTYPSPGAPQIANRVRALMPDTEPVAERPEYGLDHGAFVPLMVMYPAADVPVLQISMPMQMTEEALVALGAELSPLRDEGVFILATGNLVHDLRHANLAEDPEPPEYARAFDAWVATALEHRDGAAPSPGARRRPTRSCPTRAPSTTARSSSPRAPHGAPRPASPSRASSTARSRGAASSWTDTRPDKV